MKIFQKLKQGVSHMVKPMIITIGNNKGGVGKSTTCVNLSAGIASAGYQVLVIDGDPQSNTTSTLLPDFGLRENYSLVKALEDPEGAFSPNACPTRTEHLEIVPNSIRCMEWEVRSYSSIDSVLGFSRLLQNDKDISKYDFVIIDTPPNIGPMLRNALLISHSVLVPCPVGDQYALDGFSTFIQVLFQAKQQNKALNLLGVVLTKMDGRAVTHKKNKSRIRAFFDAKGIPVFGTEIRVNIDIDRAHSHRKTIFEFDATKSGAQDYLALAKEVIERVQQKD